MDDIYSYDVPVTNMETENVRHFLIMSPTLEDAAEQGLIEAFMEFGWRRVTTNPELIERLTKAEPVSLIKLKNGIVALAPKG